MIKRKLIVLLMIITFTTSVNAQLVVAAPDVEAAVSAQASMLAGFAFEEKIREYEHYMEYVARMIEIIKTINYTTSTIRNVVRLGKQLKNKSAKEWLNEAEAIVDEKMPYFGELKEEINDLKGQGKALRKGKYFDYVSKWDSQSLSYHESLCDNYQKHVMFPELFPLSAKAHGFKSKSGDAVVQKAWVESGMEQEMGDDMVRRRLFGQYYEQFMEQAKKNDNIEAVGIAKVLQSNYIISEDINHLRKNSDVKIMKMQFDTDAQKAHEDTRKKRQKEAMEEGKPTEKDSIFSLDKKKEK